MAGAALGLALTISLELLPLAILLAAMLALRWLMQAESRGWLVHFLVALALTSLAGFTVTRGLTDLSDRCNIFVPAGFGIAAAGTGLLALAPRMPRLPLLLALGLIAATALGGSLLLISQCAAFNPLSTNYGLGTAIPVWHYHPAMIAQMVVPPVIGLIAALQLYGRSHAWLARFWLEYSLLLAGALLLSIFHTDSSAFACALAAAPLAWQLHRWLRAAQAIRRPLRRIPAFAAMVLAVMPGLPLMTIASL